MAVDPETLLMKAVEKNVELWSCSKWNTELIDIAPPVLWFGNLMSEKRKILTIGANPSRREFFESREGRVPLKKPRLTLLTDRQDLQILDQNESIRKRIIDGFNHYFDDRGNENPYTQWFGKKSGGKVEGFVNGMGASFYETSDLKLSAVHADLFPFATMKNFTVIKKQVVTDLFSEGWAPNLLGDIIDLVNPIAVIVQGKGNVEQFKDFFGAQRNDISNGEFSYHDGNDKRYDVPWSVGTSYGRIPTACIELNLGNPKGCSKGELNQFGECILEKLLHNGSNT